MGVVGAAGMDDKRTRVLIEDALCRLLCMRQWGPIAMAMVAGRLVTSSERIAVKTDMLQGWHGTLGDVLSETAVQGSVDVERSCVESVLEGDRAVIAGTLGVAMDFATLDWQVLVWNLVDRTEVWACTIADTVERAVQP